MGCKLGTVGGYFYKMDSMQHLFKVRVMNDKRYIFVMRCGPQNAQIAF
jgi:hypothetical protein